MMTSSVDVEAPTPASLLEAHVSITQGLMDLKMSVALAARTIVGLWLLPTELRAHVFRYVLDSPDGCVLLRREATDTLRYLQTWPEQRHQCISVSGALFARWINIEDVPHLAGLYQRSVDNSVQIKGDDTSWDFIVAHIDMRGITDVQFVKQSVLSDVKTSASVQILRRSELVRDEIWLILEVISALSL